MVCVFKQKFLVFKEHYTYFHILFHPHVFSQVFSNNNFQFLNICTKRALNMLNSFSFTWNSSFEENNLKKKKEKKEAIFPSNFLWVLALPLSCVCLLWGAKPSRICHEGVGVQDLHHFGFTPLSHIA